MLVHFSRHIEYKTKYAHRQFSKQIEYKTGPTHFSKQIEYKTGSMRFSKQIENKFDYAYEIEQIDLAQNEIW